MFTIHAMGTVLAVKQLKSLHPLGTLPVHALETKHVTIFRNMEEPSGALQTRALLLLRVIILRNNLELLETSKIPALQPIHARVQPPIEDPPGAF
jgi:hypothetical protein